ncbi:hypothetical protein BG006_008766 [Podila minutissima]|uniref:Fungal lipase-type domain-containing protein n=1 Tax=Podila minutissima TaxID=64525 RepID=A0A9P5VJD2_9FUNG|nr:hypothetical protein BG006_008766 [Podila minutissima]
MIPPPPTAAELAASREQKAIRRRQKAPPKNPVNSRHLNEFYPQSSQPTPNVPEPTSPKKPTGPTEKPTKDHKLKHPLSIKPMRLKDFLLDGLNLYFKHLRHPSQIPGNDTFSRIYAMGVLPVLIVAMTIIQWGIGILVILVNHTEVGVRLYAKFFQDQISLNDDTDYIDLEGNDEAIRQLTSLEQKSKPSFSYHIANLLLIMSSMAYERNEKLVAEASQILMNVQNQAERERAAKLLEESEQDIDEKSTSQFGMRFAGISELKTLGGPFAGLFYNDEAIVLVFKGTSVLAFNEYLIDVTIQRIDASEFLYGEVHKGFYESLFPDPKPTDDYETDTYDRTNPFNTIMETIFETAQKAKAKTGKPVNLWITGHSLGGALAAMVMARLQMPLHGKDPLMQDEDERNEVQDISRKPNRVHHNNSDNATRGGTAEEAPRTVWDEMLARFSADSDLVVLRDAYSVASPKLGDSGFAATFGRNHAQFCRQSAYKPAYWRLVADKDIVPRMPPGCSADSKNPLDHLLAPCLDCHCCPQKGQRPILFASSSDSDNPVRNLPPHTLDNDTTPPNELATTSLPLSQSNSSQTLSQELDSIKNDKTTSHRSTYPEPPKHLHSLLDYQHIGQLVKVFHSAKVPVAKPSPFETDMSQDVLRKKKNMVEFLEKLEVMRMAWSQQVPSTAAVEAPASGSSNQEKKDEQQELSTRVQQAQKQLQEDMVRARELYNVDEQSLPREPGPFEQILLSFPSLLSHAPTAYQRNLVRARFYFESFPGSEFEERVDQWVQDEIEEEEDAEVEATRDEEEEGVLREDEEELHFTFSETKKAGGFGPVAVEA